MINPHCEEAGRDPGEIRHTVLMPTFVTDDAAAAKAFVDGRISIFGGDQYRPLLHVKDVGYAIAANIESDLSGAFNLHQTNMRIRDLADHLALQFPDLKVDYTDVAFQDNRNYQVSSDKAIDGFGFLPKYSVNDGILEVRELLEQGRIKDASSPRYSNSDYIRTLPGLGR